MKKCLLIFTILLAALFSNNAFAATYYVRTDGGPGGSSSTTCDGLTDAAFTGSNGPNCAFNHPNWPLPYQNGVYSPNSGTYAIAGGDTVIIKSGSYRMGCPNDTSNCLDTNTNHTTNISSATYVAGDIKPPNGTLGTETKIYGCSASGCADPADKPELWLVGRMDRLFNLTGKSYIKFKDFEITDHWGNDGECGSGFPVNYCGRAAFYSSGSDWHDLTFEGMDIHGLTRGGFHKWGGPGAGGSDVNWVMTNTNVDGNKSAGVDMDTCGNNGQCGITGSIDFTNVNMRWNGCSEAYPVTWGPDGVDGKVGRLPTVQSCREGNNAGYGDMIGTSDTGGDWTIIGGNFSHNTSDAFDFLYCGRNDRAAYGNCTVTIKRARMEGNNGQVVKGPEPYVEDSMIIGNCSFWSNSAVDYTATGFGTCRAGGTPISIQYRTSPAKTAKFYNNTIFGNGDVMFLPAAAGQTTCNLEVKNNILIGAFDYHGVDRTAMYYEETCTAFVPDEDYNLCDGEWKTQYNDCDAANDQFDVDPLFSGAVLSYLGNNDPPTGYYTGTDFWELFYLSASSPARDAADETIAGDDSVDVNNFDRGASWDLGALEYGTVEGPGGPTCGDNTTASPEVCDGTDLNGYNCTTVPGSTWDGGTLACLSDCTDYDTSACTSTPNCGNAVIDAGEDCDTNGPLLNGATCASLGFSADPADDNLACTAGTCLYDTSSCAAIACQDGYKEGSEQCDDGNATEGDGCSSLCTNEDANYELFLNYTETDPNSRIAVAVHKASLSSLTRNESANLKVDKGAGNIGDYVYDYVVDQSVCVDSTGASIVYDAGAEDTGVNITTDTFAHTVAAGSNRLLVVSVGREEFGTNRAITGVTYDGVAMTFGQSVTTAAGNNKMSVYYLLAPNVGTANVVVTYSGQVGATITSADSWANMVQQSPEVTSTSDQSANNFVTSTNNALAINSMVAGLSSATISTLDDERHNFANAGNLAMGVSSKQVINAGADSMTWSVSGGDWATVTLVFESLDTGGDNPAALGVLGVASASYGDLKAQETAGDGHFLYITCKSSVNQNVWNLVTVDSGTSTDTYTDANYNITRYGRLERSGTTLTNKVYSDVNRTTLLDTQTVTTTATTHRYISVAASYNDSVTGTSFTGDVYNLDLTGTGAPVTSATESFIMNGQTISGSTFP